MLKKIHPDKLRYLIFASNLGLMGLMIWFGLVVFGLNNVLFFFGHDVIQRVEGFSAVQDLEAYVIQLPKTTGNNGSIKMAIVRNMEPPPPPPPPPAEKTDEDTQEDAVDVVKEGPLSEKWEIASAIISPIKSNSYLYLSEAKKSAVTPGRSNYTGRNRYSGRSTSTRSTTGRYTASKKGDTDRTLRVYDARKSPDPEKIGDYYYYLMSVEEDKNGIVAYYKTVAADKYKSEQDKDNQVLPAQCKDTFVIKREEEPATIDIKPEPEEDEKKSTTLGGKVTKEDDDRTGRISVPGAPKPATTRKLGSSSTARPSTVRSTRPAVPPKTSPAKSSTIKRATPPPSREEQMKQLKNIRDRMPADKQKELDEGLKKISK